MSIWRGLVPKSKEQTIKLLRELGCSESELKYIDKISDEEFWKRYGP